jgi:transcriptional regulator with XRE-family HTH domain
MAADLELAGRLRALRTSRGHSITEVAEATGVSASFISLVETGKSDITFGRLVRLIEFYDADFDDLVGARNSDVVVIRAGEESHVNSPGEGIDAVVLAHRAHGSMTPVIAVYDEGGSTREPLPLQGDQFVYVIKGAIELALDGRDPLRLAKGDSAFITSDLPRTYRNVGKGVSRVLFVATRRPG